MFWKKPYKWSKLPGCFERHLQRRNGNILFPLERRYVSKEEIELARKRDKTDQEIFANKIREFMAQLNNPENINSASIQHTSSILQKIQTLIEEASSIGGNINNEIHILEHLEKTLIQNLNDTMPEGRNLLESAESLSTIARTSYLAQLKRIDTPILKNEEVPTLLSEDLDTISVVGLASRSFPNFRPSTADIENNLNVAVHQGFSKERAQQIINAWNKIPSVQKNL